MRSHQVEDIFDNIVYIYYLKKKINYCLKFKDIGGSVRVLKQMLANPLVLRDSSIDLDKPQVPIRSINKVIKIVYFSLY